MSRKKARHHNLNTQTIEDATAVAIKTQARAAMESAAEKIVESIQHENAPKSEYDRAKENYDYLKLLVEIQEAGIEYMKADLLALQMEYEAAKMRINAINKDFNRKNAQLRLDEKMMQAQRMNLMKALGAVQKFANKDLSEKISA